MIQFCHQRFITSSVLGESGLPVGSSAISAWDGYDRTGYRHTLPLTAIGWWEVAWHGG